MIDKKCVFYLLICIALFFSLEYPTMASGKSLDRVVLQTEVAEYCGSLRTYKEFRENDISTGCENEIESRTASNRGRNIEIKEKYRGNIRKPQIIEGSKGKGKNYKFNLIKIKMLYTNLSTT